MQSKKCPHAHLYVVLGQVSGGQEINPPTADGSAGYVTVAVVLAGAVLASVILRKKRNG